MTNTEQQQVRDLLSDATFATEGLAGILGAYAEAGRRGVVPNESEWWVLGATATRATTWLKEAQQLVG